MQFQKPTISITLPSTAGPGDTRIYIGQPVDPTLNNAYSNPPGPGDPVIANIIFYQGGTGDHIFNFIAQFDGLGFAIGTYGPGGVYEQIFIFEGSVSTTDLGYDPGYNLPDETWHTATLQNGWTNNTPALQYRRVPSPSFCAQIVGSMNPGTKADGTVITNLPAGYRPTHGVDINANANAMAGQSPHFFVNTNGDVSCWGFTAATQASVNALIPLDV